MKNYPACKDMQRHTVKPVQKGHSQKDQKLVFKTNYRLMQVKSIAEHSAILSTVIKTIFVLSNFEWPFYCIEYWPFY